MTTEPTPLRRNARFQLLWIGASASTLGSRMSVLAYPLLVLAITGSPARAGLVSTAQLLGLLVLAGPAGVLVDRWDRRRIMIACEAVRTAGVASVGLAVFAGAVTLPHLIAVAVVQGAASAMFLPTYKIAIRAVVPRSQLSSAVTQEEVRAHAGALAGPPLGGILFGVGRAVPFLVDAVSYLVSLVCIVAVRVPRRPVAAAGAGRRGTRRGMAGEIAEAARWLWGQRFLRAVTLFALVVNLGTSGMMLPVIVLIRDQGGSAALVGTVLAMMGVGGLLGAMLAARLGRLLPLGMFVLAFGWWFAIAVSAMVLPLGPFWPGAMLGLVMLVNPALSVAMQTTLLSSVPDEMMGRVGSLSMMSSLCVAPLGPLVIGLLTQVAGAAHTLLILGGFLAAVTAAAGLAPGLRRGPDPAPPDALPTPPTEGVPEPEPHAPHGAPVPA